MEDLILMIVIGLLLYGAYFVYTTEQVERLSDFYDYNGHVVVEKIDRKVVIPNIVILKSDTSRTRFFVDEIIYKQLEVGEEIRVRSIV